MFCTQCGTQIDQGKTFCKSCGTRVGRPAEPVSSEPAVQPAATPSPINTAKPAESAEAFGRPVQPAPVSPPRASGGSNKAVVIGAGVAVILLAGAGVYFGTELLKPSANQASLPVEDPVAKTTDAGPLPSFEEEKDPAAAGDNTVASLNPPLQSPPEPSVPVETAKPAPEILPKPGPRADVPPPSTKSQFPRAGQDAPPSGRVNRQQPEAPASRGGASPGVYETLRATTVYEGPSGSAKVLASIPPGIRVNVVSSNGEWLEVHSKRGNPPGFIRRNDAAFIERSN